ncbi:MAG: HAD family phosphatase [Chitinophagaceae bacterium]|nr:HAD family phosphatase [Chitinophagaceae bacterium]
MQNIKNIIFDLGGVILDIDFKKTEKAFIDLGVTNFNELFGLGRAESFFKDHESGKITDDEFLGSLQKLAGHSFEAGLVQEAWNALLISFPPERIELLKRIKDNYRLFLLSNTNGIHRVAFEKIYRDGFNNGSLDSLFEKAYYSYQIGLRKPNKEAYEFVLKENQLVPEETLFIDDALINVEAARECGMQGIHLQPGQTLLDLGL